MASPQVNKDNINDNRRKLFLLEHQVLKNKADIYLTRETIMENRSAIQKNYEAAFNGNRQLANANTDAMFRNRSQIVRNLPSDDQVKANFREAMLNKVKIEALDHRSKLNEKVNSVSEELAAINARLIEINVQLRATTVEAIKFNHDLIAVGKSWIENGVDGAKTATPESNAKLIAENASKIDEISKRVEVNAKKNAANYAQTQANKFKIEANAATILSKRAEMEANRHAIEENSAKIAAAIKN